MKKKAIILLAVMQLIFCIPSPAQTPDKLSRLERREIRKAKRQAKRIAWAKDVAEYKENRYKLKTKDKVIIGGIVAVFVFFSNDMVGELTNN